MSYAHIRQSKLEPRALRCVMIGYQKGVKGYRLWCIEPGNQNVVISRDVQFEESRMPFLEKNQSKESSESEGSAQVEVMGSERSAQVEVSRETDNADFEQTEQQPVATDDNVQGENESDPENNQQSLDDYMLAY